MKYTVEFEVEEGNCELYRNFDENDVDSACNTCLLKDANYCMDLNMHLAKVVKTNLK